jgi:hypothetical protein
MSAQPAQPQERLMDHIERRLGELQQEMGGGEPPAPKPQPLDAAPRLPSPPAPLQQQQQQQQLPLASQQPLQPLQSQQLPQLQEYGAAQPRLTESVLRGGSQTSSRQSSLRAPSPASAVSSLDPCSTVVWMLCEMELIVRQFVASLRMRLGSMRRPADQVLETALRHCERVERELATKSASSTDPDTPLSMLAAEGFTDAQATAVEAADQYRRAHAAHVQGSRALKEAHHQVLRALDAAVANGGDFVPRAREQAECIYAVKRREIAPRVLAQYMEQSGQLLSRLCDASLERCTKAPMFSVAPAGRIHAQFKTSLQSLGDAMRSTRP